MYKCIFIIKLVQIMKRNEQREQAFILIFEKIFRDDTIEDILNDALAAEEYKNNKYSELCFRGVYENIDEIDGIISENLNNWTIDRISKVSLSILRLAIYEIKYIDEVPEGVAINEAIELCKKYSTSEDASFVNGVLGSISRES